MNIELRVFVRFSGPARELEPLVQDISDAVVKNGYGVKDDDNLVSLVVLKQSEIDHYENPSDFAKYVIEDAISVVIPTEGENNDGN